MRQYQAVIDKKYSCVITLDDPADNAPGYVTGHVADPEHGSGAITARVQGDGSLSGDVTLGMHTAKFTATILPTGHIEGEIKYGWFIRLGFTGTLIQPAAPGA